MQCNSAFSAPFATSRTEAPHSLSRHLTPLLPDTNATITTRRSLSHAPIPFIQPPTPQLARVPLTTERDPESAGFVHPNGRPSFGHLSVRLVYPLDLTPSKAHVTLQNVIPFANPMHSQVESASVRHSRPLPKVSFESLAPTTSRSGALPVQAHSPTSNRALALLSPSGDASCRASSRRSPGVSVAQSVVSL